MTKSLSLRKGDTSDRSFLLNLRKATMDEHLLIAGIPMDDEAHLARIDEFFEDSIIVQFNNKPIGLVKLAHFNDRLHIRQLQILPEYQNKNVGSKIIKRILLRAHQLKLPVTLNVLKQNRAKNFYLRHGFLVEKELDIEYFMRSTQ